MTMTRVVIVIIAGTLALLHPAGLATAQPPVPEPAPSRLRLDVDSLSPRVITADTTSVTVTGTVTNTGDRRIDDVRVQLRRGQAVTSEQELRDGRDALSDSAVWARTPFVSVSRALEQGQRTPITLTVPVRGGDTSLHIDEPGVYPVQVNVNGAPEFGGQTRLATASMLLPALSVPDGGGVRRPADPARLTMLWPLVDDHPRQLPTADGRLLLADDELTDSLGPGGRLHALVNAVQQAAAAHPDLLDALCFAVDPDLLETVEAMAAGEYRVRQPDGQTATGRGVDAAQTWLQRLRALTADQCVIALPYADADLVALSRAGAVDLADLALRGRSDVSSVLAPARPLPGVLWPVGGTLDQRTLLDLAGAGTGTTTVLADPAHLSHREGREPYLVGESVAAGTRAVPIDVLVSSFLNDETSSQPATAGQRRPVSVQNGLAALTFRTAFGTGTGDSVVIAPPRRWAAPDSELGAFLDTMARLIDDGLATAQSLRQLVAATPGGTASGLDYTADDTSVEITPVVTAEVVRINDAQRDLVRAMAVDDTTKVEPQLLVNPIQFGLLRATSAAWRGRADAAGRAVTAVAGHLDGLRGQVTVANPGRPLTLASGNSPIPVLLSNALPVSVVVRINLSPTPGLRPGPMPDVVIPARGSQNVYLPAEVTRGGRFTVDVSLSTPGGTPLGSVARHELTSTAYGAVTLVLTGTAAAVLLVLVGLRIFRRIRPAGAGSAPDARPTEERAD